MQKKNRICVILSGGKASRMNRDKPFLMHQGESFLVHAVRLGLNFADEVFILGKKNDRDYPIKNFENIDSAERSKIRYMADTVEFAGPLFAVKNFIQNYKSSKTDYRLLMLSIDMPLLNMKMVDLLFTKSDKKKCPWVYFQDADHDHFFPSVIHSSLFNDFSSEDLKNRGFYSVVKRIPFEKICKVSVPSEDAFLLKNINTLEDYHSL